MTETIAYIGLGGNLGDRESNIQKALEMLNQTESVKHLRTSDIIETEALGYEDQPKYLNAVAELKTTFCAEKLLRVLSGIENSLGRVREAKWSSRTIDLDILLYGDQIIETPTLTVPHPQMHLRSFVLKGLCQIDANLIHPVLKVSVSELESRLNGMDFAINPDSPQVVSIAGNIGAGKTTLAKKLARYFNSEVLSEPYDTNPYLPEVYAGKSELALDSQLYFLTARAEQLNPNSLECGRLWLTDYVFEKELIYARRLLDARQLTLYEEIYHSFSVNITVPVLVLYLNDSANNCLKRIHRRNRPYEQRIDLPFLAALSEDYDRLFANWTSCPVIRAAKCEDINTEHLANQIKQYTNTSFLVAASKEAK